MRLTPALFLLWILATTSAALAPQAEPGFEPFEELPLAGQGTFLRAVSGEFTGDGIPDAVVLRDQRVSLLYGPNQYRGPGGNALSFTLTNDENESESVSDIAVFGEGGFDLTDAILTVGPEGLVRWRWLPNSGGFERVEIPGPWSAPQRIATWHPPASPLGWVAVLRADGLTVDVLTFVEATGDPLSQTTRQLGPHIEEIGLYDGNQDVTPEIFAIRNGDLEVWDLYDSLPAVTIPAGPGGGHVAVLREADTSAERLAWVTEVDGQLAIQTVAGVVVDSPVFIGPYVLETIAGGDYDRDGYEDLLVASSSPERFVVYRNQQGDGSSQTFDPGLPVSVLGEGEAQEELPDPLPLALFADLEQDQDEADLVLFDGGQSRVLLVRSGAVDELALELPSPMEEPEGVIVDTGTPQFQYRIKLLPPPVLPNDATGLEIIAWFDGTDEDSVLGQPDYSATFDIPTSEQEFVISFTEPAVPDHYYWDFEIRLIEDIPGKPKKTYAPRLIGLDLEVLRPQLRGGNLRGMTFPIVCIPPFGEGEVPIVVP